MTYFVFVRYDTYVIVIWNYIDNISDNLISSGSMIIPFNDLKQMEFTPNQILDMLDKNEFQHIINN